MIFPLINNILILFYILGKQNKLSISFSKKYLENNTNFTFLVDLKKKIMCVNEVQPSWLSLVENEGE